MPDEQIEIDFNKGKLLSGIIYPEFFQISKNETVLNIGCGDGVQAIIYKNSFKKMTGIDINEKRLKTAKQLAEYYSIGNFEIICANAEEIPLNDEFDKIIAIDIIEHVVHPTKMVSEIKRLLKDDGKLLITFPAMHDKWENLFRFIGRKILRRKKRTMLKIGWNPDAHQYDYSLKQWLDIMDGGGFRLIRCRASTLFPPLHYLGIPKFWFSNRIIHKIDNFFCNLSFLKNFGQSLVCVFEKI